MNYILSPNTDTTLSVLLQRYHLEKNVTAKTILDSRQIDPEATGANLTVQLASNWELIQRRYSVQEQADNVGKYPTGNVLVKKGTQLFLLPAYVNRYLYRDSNQVLKQNLVKTSTVRPFIASRLKELLFDPNYTQIYKRGRRSYLTLDNNEVTVYVWCRALSNPGGQQGGWLNLSGLVTSVHTEVNSQLGTFSFALPSINGSYTGAGWRLDDLSKSYQGSSVEADTLSQYTIIGQRVTSDSFFTLTRQPSFFANVLQKNDLIYIKMERLALDDQIGILNTGPQAVANQVWDLIGTIDTVGDATSPSSAQVTVRGRDLMKLFIDDGSYFFPEQFAQNLFTDENSLLTKRNKLQLDAQSVAGSSYSFKTISTILKFLFNKFSNIGYVPNTIFSSYGDRLVTQKYQLSTSELSRIGEQGQIIDTLNASFLMEPRQGLWQICGLVLDPEGADRVLADNSICQDSGSLINSVRKLCQEPFVEFYGDTYRDKYYFVVRKQPFDQAGVLGMVYGNVVTDTLSDQVNGNSLVGKDDALQEKIRAGTLLGGSVVTPRGAILSPLVIDIDGSEVLSEPNFSYHHQAYSWYRLIPRGLGVQDEISNFLLAPIVPFDEYAEVFGNQTLTLEYNYSPSEYLQDAQDQARQSYIEAQTIYDLQFLVQCNMYLPFTRYGTLVLTGDRTIKRGTYVYYTPTDEVFYVDGGGVLRGRSKPTTGSRETLPKRTCELLRSP